MKKYIWLFGENVGKTANNNSYYLWKYIVNKYDDVDAYFVVEKNNKTKALYQAMNSKEKKFLIWRNSMQHLSIYFFADMLFVTLSFRDVQPDQIWKKSYQPEPTQPLVYLQHGITAMKQLSYQGNYANNSLFKWVYYNPMIDKDLKQINGFQEYQLYYGVYLPRYMELVKKYKLEQPHERKNILWFMTWREYFGNNFATKKLLKDIFEVVSDDSLQEYLNKTGSTFTIYLHQKFTDEQTEKIREQIKQVKQIQVLDALNTDVMDEIIKNDVLITDYSSLGFDFTLLNKPVILYQPDINEYIKKRKFYCSDKELQQFAISNRKDLIEELINESYEINCFFRRRLPEQIDLEGIEQGKYIDSMYSDFWNMQKNSIAFLGYDFSGVGGTVFATNALAEGLREKGYLVRMFTLKRMQAGRLPFGVPIHPMYNRYKLKLIEKIKRCIFIWQRHLRYLKDDPAKEAIPPVAGLGMTFWMKYLHANTVISTRESLHFFLHESKSQLIKNKFYFFHTSSDVVDELFPGVIKKLDELNLECALFVTEKNKKGLEEKCGLKNYQKYAVIGNSLPSNRSITREKIKCSAVGEKIRTVYLLRMSQERAKDIDNLISFGQYLKNNSVENIIINVYGTGDYFENFVNAVIEGELENIIVHQGVTQDVTRTIKQYDAVLDFSQSQSFGMTYIESIMNGKMVYCMHNEGADEVLKDIPECFYTSWSELLDKLNNITNITQEILEKNYDIISEKYSRQAVTQNFIELL